jgi:LysR family glycine cleavage system transcriptional activator
MKRPPPARAKRTSPPLRAIEIFEVVGRHGSVSKAAEELGVSSGAVTQQIRLLENSLQLRLLQRSGRGIALTSWGVLYLERISLGLEQLRKAAGDVERIRRSGHLVLSALPSMANKWLNRLVFDWLDRHEGVSVRLEARDAEPQLEHGEADFRVSYGTRHRKHIRYVSLFTDYVIVVASPALMSKGGAPRSPKDLLGKPLLWVEWLTEYLAAPNWTDWFTSLDIACRELRCDVSFSAPSGAIDAAIEGRGFALVQHSTAAGALQTGDLVRVFPHTLPLPESHFVAWSVTALDKPAGAAFLSWIRESAAAFDYRG